MKQQQRRHFPLVILFLISVLTPSVVMAVSGADIDEFDTKDDDNSALFNWLPGETFDPRTSTMGYYVTDLHVEGTGLDINVNRKFNMPIEPFTQGSVYPQSFGTMMIDTPRLEYTTWEHDDSTPKCSGLVVSRQNQDPSGSVVISGSGLTFHADNRAINFFPKSLGSYSASRFPSSAEYVSSNNWYIDCDGTTFKVHQPNGRVYHLNVQEFHSIKTAKLDTNAKVIGLRNSTKKTVYVSKVVDPHNNYLIYTYTNQSRVWIGQSFNQKVLSTIRANDGREVTVQLKALPSQFSTNLKKQCPPIVEKISYNKDPSKNVRYEYDERSGPNDTACQLHLNRVVKNDGGTFHFDYNFHMTDESYPLSGGLQWAESTDDDDDVSERARHAIKSITYPEGAKVSYQYIPLAQCAFTAKITVTNTDAKDTCANIPALSQRSITGDLIPAGMTWSFSTQELDEAGTMPKTFRSVINGPAVNGRRTRQIFQYVVKYANSEPRLVGTHDGKLIEHQVIDLPADNSNTGYLIKKTNYTWGFYGDVVDFSKLNAWDKSKKFAWQHLNKSRGRRLVNKTIVVDDNTFKTVYASFDQYGNSQRHAQYHGTIGRTVALNYYNKLNPWIIGKVSKKTIEKVDGTNDFMALDRTFHSTGQVNGERINGLLNAYTYNANGELHTVKNGSIQMASFDHYTLGTPTTLIRASSEGSALKLVTLHPSGKIKTESAWDKTSVKNTYTYGFGSGKVEKIEPHTTQNTYINYPEWNNASDADFRREYARTGAMYRNITYHDTLGRPTIEYEQDPGNGDISFTYSRYDANGRLAYQSLPVRNNYLSQKGNIYNAPMPAGYKFEYDVLGRVTRKTHTVNNSQTQYCYSKPSCQRIGMLNQKQRYGKVTKDAKGYVSVVNYRAFAHPSNQHVIEIHQQIEGQDYVSTVINRDRIHRINSVIQDGKTRSYTYKAGTLLLASETHPETGTTTYPLYDNRGNLKKKITADGAVTNFAYYPNNLIKAITTPSGTDNMAFTYYSDDSLKSLISGGVTKNFTYRDDGLLNSETLKVDTETMTLGYDYDDYGFVNKTTYPSGQNVQQTNNTFGWLKGIPGVVTDVHYYGNGVMKQAVLTNGQKFSSTLDANERVKTWKTLDQEGHNDVLDLEYTYHLRNNIASLKDKLDPSRDIGMAYDGLSRLTIADSNGLWGTGRIAYNRSGDIIQLKLGTEQLDYNYAFEYPTGQKGLLRNVSSTSGLNNTLFEYDQNGNVIDNGKRSFTYDKANRMTHADTGGRVYDFIYDGDGRRVRSIRQDTNTNNTPIASTKVTQYFFYNSAGKLMYEKNKNTGMRKDHIYANGKVIAERHYYNSLIDTDDDGIPNHYEELYGLQPDNNQDATNDSDNDGLNNFQEFEASSNPNSVDTDNDGVNDLIEADYDMNIIEDDGFEDADGDGVTNYNEIIAGTNPADHLVKQRMLAIVPILEVLLAPDAN